MKRLHLFLFIIPLVVVSCGKGGAEKVADEFHQKLDEGEHTYIIENLADKESKTPEAEWKSFLELVESWGPQKNREKKMAVSHSVSNGEKTVKLSYTFETDTYGLIHERIILVKRGNDFKVFAVFMDSDEAVVIEQTKDY